MFDNVLNTTLNKTCEKGLKIEKSATFIMYQVLAKSNEKSITASRKRKIFLIEFQEIYTSPNCSGNIFIITMTFRGFTLNFLLD